MALMDMRRRVRMVQMGTMGMSMAMTGMWTPGIE